MTGIKSQINFTEHIRWKKINKDGVVVDSGEVIHNQVQTLVKEEVIDALNDDTTYLGDIVAMGVGTGTGQNAAAAALATKVSDEDCSQSQPTATSLKNTASFTGITGTVTEAGLFPASVCTANMYFYNGGLSVALTSSDTLQIEWTINCTGT
jgi:hypothetical protein